MKPSFLSDDAIHLDRLFAVYGDNPALLTPSGTWTFDHVRGRLTSVIGNLGRSGVRRGDRVAIHAENGEAHLYLFLAAWMMDFLYMPLDFKAPLAALLSDMTAEFLVTAGDVPPSCPSCVIQPDDLMMTYPDEGRAWRAIPLAQESAVIFTSGSTGKPRGIVHTVGNYVYSALGTNEFIGLEPRGRWLLSLPLFHVGGVLIWVRTLLSGSTCIVPGSLKDIETAIRTYRPSVVSLVPAQLIRLLASEESVAALREAKTVLLGGAPPPAWLIDRALDLSIPIMPSYGATESCAQVTGVRPGADRGDYYTAGSVLPYREVRITEDGAILLGGKTIFKRYLHEHDTRTSLADGFFETADAGRIDKSGNLVIMGRRDGVFISGGENIHPFEIENHLLAMDHVVAAIVTPVPHREFGMVPWAFVETDEPIGEAELIAALKTRLPSYKVPKRIIRLDPEGKRTEAKYSRVALTKLAGEMARGTKKGTGT